MDTPDCLQKIILQEHELLAECEKEGDLRGAAIEKRIISRLEARMDELRKPTGEEKEAAGERHGTDYY